MIHYKLLLALICKIRVRIEAEWNLNFIFNHHVRIQQKFEGLNLQNFFYAHQY